MSRTTANSLMLLAALIWGTTFVAQQLGMKSIGPLFFTGIRFTMGALFIAPFALREYMKLREMNTQLDRHDLYAWLGLGLLLFLGAILQQIGMLTTTVTNAGFLTGLYVPIVPLLVWIVDGKRPLPMVWVAALGSFLGIFLLSNAQFSSLTSGDYWIILSVIFWSGHVLFVGRVAAKKGAPILVAMTQFIVCGVLSLIIAPMFESISYTGFVNALPAILYSGLLSVGVAFTLQVVAQRYTRATDAAVILSSETLFAALAGAIVLNERLELIQIMGCALIFICILGVQLLPERVTAHVN